MIVESQLTTQLFIALIGLITSLGTLAAAYAAYLKSKMNSQKLDDTRLELSNNTTITKRVETATNGTLADALKKIDAIHALIVTNQQAAPPSKEAI